MPAQPRPPLQESPRPRLAAGLAVAALALALVAPASPAAAGEALVLWDSFFGRPSLQQGAAELALILQSRGMTVDLRDTAFAGPDPGDLSRFDCVWDLSIDFDVNPVEQMRLIALAQLGNRGIYLAGEHGAFTFRNGSLEQTILLLGGGPSFIDPTPASSPTPIDVVEPVNPANPAAQSCNPASEVVYNGIGSGRFMTSGAGTWLSGAPSPAGAVSWPAGALAAAPTSRLVVALDSNWIAPFPGGTLDVRTDGVTPTQNRTLLNDVATFLCALPASSCGGECEPRNHGYWHRYCLGTGLIDPGRNGGGNGPGPTADSASFPANLPALVDAALAAHGVQGCQALDEGPFSDDRLAALRELATLHFDLEVGYLKRSCPVELAPVDSTPGLTVADALQLIEARLADGSRVALQEARWIGEHVANGEALVR